MPNPNTLIMGAGNLQEVPSDADLEAMVYGYDALREVDPTKIVGGLACVHTGDTNMLDDGDEFDDGGDGATVNDPSKR